MPNPRRLRLLVIWVLVLAILGTGAFFLYKRRNAAPPAAYISAAVERGDITMTVTATGTLSAVTTVQVGSQVSGIIARLHADFNSRVHKGQLLAELDPTPFEAQVQQRQADLEQSEVQRRNSEVNFRRQEKLLKDGLTAPTDYDNAKATWEGAVARVGLSKASLDQAETNLRYTKILSPIDGVVVDRQYDVGQTVAASFQAPTLFTIAQDLTKMQVQADVDQSDIGRVQVGQPAHFTVDAYPGREFPGEIRQIRLNATVNQNVITYPVIIGVDNPEERLRPKMTADVTVNVAEVKNALRIPNSALRFRPPDQGTDSKSAAQAGSVNSTPRTGGSRPSFSANRPNGESRRSEAAGAGAAAEGRPRGKGPRREQTIYLLESPTKLKPITVRIGITDGKFTEVLDGELKEGDKVAIGLPTAKAEEANRGSAGGPPRMRF